MRKKLAIGGIACLLLMSMVFVSTCEKELIGPSPETQNDVGLTRDQINWARPKAEYADKLDELAKRGYAGAWISPERGGFVGGFLTLGNYVYIPAGAVESRTYFTVDVIKETVGDVNTLMIEYLPGMNFLKPVTLTLSWDFLDISLSDIQSGNFDIYYSQDGELWYPVDHSIMTFNYYFKTVSFNTDHFSRWGWTT